MWCEKPSTWSDVRLGGGSNNDIVLKRVGMPLFFKLAFAFNIFEKNTVFFVERKPRILGT